MNRYLLAGIGATGVTAMALAGWKLVLLFAEAVQYNGWILAGTVVWSVFYLAAVRGGRPRG